jgi:hypothetical protein
MLRVQAPLYRRGPGYRFRWRFGRLPAPRRRRPWRDLPALLWQRHFIKCLSPGPASGGHIPSLSPRIPSWGRVFDRSLAGRGRGARHSCPAPLPLLSGPSYFGQTTVKKLCLHPSGGAGLLVLKPWGLLGRQPTYCLARGAPPKSSPRQSLHDCSYHMYVCLFHATLMLATQPC